MALIRAIYQSDIPQSPLAFVRLKPEAEIKQSDDIGIIHIASVPQKVKDYEWQITAIFFDDEKITEIDGFNGINDDEDLRNYLSKEVTIIQWPFKEHFFTQWSIAGRPISKIWHEAFDKGRQQGIDVKYLFFSVSNYMWDMRICVLHYF